MAIEFRIVRNADPRIRFAAREMAGTALPVAAALLPKCPICWAAYLSTFGSTLGIAGIRFGAYSRWLLPILLLFMGTNLSVLWLQGHRRGKMAGFWLAAAGAFSIGVLGLYLDVPYAALTGVMLSVAATLVNALDAGQVTSVPGNSLRCAGEDWSENRKKQDVCSRQRT